MPAEIEHVAGVITGNVLPRTWAEGAQKADFFALKGIVERLLANYALADDVRFVPTTARAEMHPGRTADIYVGETLIGFIGQVHPLTAKAYKVNETYAFELNLDAIFDLPKVKDGYEVVSRFPAVARELAILVDRDVPAADLRGAIVAAGGEVVARRWTIWRLHGWKRGWWQEVIGLRVDIRWRWKGVGFDEDINAAVENITAALADQFNAEIR